jgi:cytoskeletal protein RodZ
MSFTLKSVNPSGRIGSDLVELRERAGWSRAQAAHATKIHESLIRSLEEEAWDQVADPIYTERILRSYVTFLGGNERYFVEKYRTCLEANRLKRSPEELLPRPRRIRRFDLTVGPRLLAVSGFLVFVLLLGGYVYVQARAISTPPPLEILEPADGLRLEEPMVTIRGTTLPESTVEVNGRQAIVQPDGTFSLRLDVPRGTTLVIVTSKKRHSREVTSARRVVYDRPLPEWMGSTSTR